MSHPLDFPERNSLVFLPEFLAIGQQLPAYNDGRHLITLWQLEAEELQKLLSNGGKLYVVLSQHPVLAPLALHIESPFYPANP